MPYFQHAVELDPNFAMRLLRFWAPPTSILGRLCGVSEYLTKAFQLREHASEHEKLAITAVYYQVVTGELDKAAQTYRR